MEQTKESQWSAKVITTLSDCKQVALGRSKTDNDTIYMDEKVFADCDLEI